MHLEAMMAVVSPLRPEAWRCCFHHVGRASARFLVSKRAFLSAYRGSLTSAKRQYVSAEMLHFAVRVTNAGKCSRNRYLESYHLLSFNVFGGR